MHAPQCRGGLWWPITACRAQRQAGRGATGKAWLVRSTGTRFPIMSDDITPDPSPARERGGGGGGRDDQQGGKDGINGASRLMFWDLATTWPGSGEWRTSFFFCRRLDRQSRPTSLEVLGGRRRSRRTWRRPGGASRNRVLTQLRPLRGLASVAVGDDAEHHRSMIGIGSMNGYGGEGPRSWGPGPAAARASGQAGDLAVGTRSR
jgi:hypothetical protein